MNYEEAISYIHGTYKFGIKLGLENIRRLLSYMGNPQKSLKIIHVAGTNGKGSTSAFISNILQQAGYKVALYTSPYLEEFEERMRINGENISKEKLIYYVEYIKPIISRMVEEGYNHPTEFEVVTAIAFKYFYDEKVDFVVLEVGLGGRFDATNAIDSSLVSVITTIDYDHTDRLGHTLGEIAYEKAGIIKQKGVVVSFYQQPEAMKVIIEACEVRNAYLTVLEKSNVIIKEQNPDFQIFDYKKYKDLKITLLGEHQIYNAALAIESVEKLRMYGYEITKKDIKEGLYRAKWPGRLEVMRKKPYVVIDGAHNPQGMTALKESLKLFKYDRLILVIGMLKDKDTQKMLDIIVPEADIIITTTPISERAYKASELAQKIDKKNVIPIENIEKAVKYALDIAKEEDMVLFCGSLYMIGYVRSMLKKVIIKT
ncbi:FolC bifunctional protein [Thermoanaerobacter mathranii subsp. mathranii str. A3]|uniref:tetrahydrofolate synthase n=1 Tax=Thermoanaerobacter mathranii subsp. mathranii (strain DSM 11426 / CCUG 53645 / CIP 108742 / A3) TaxID=583358 RepID=A0ABN3Z0C0_THEM3|nr:folylpolyglutamate synthase/dihydrofolate synthase family protein [Thermoanaerobacter mathranii]ADH60527.1 FolC bifunctional protein [Thermoanaerobacter mathranii subsp. mathranii str. A3]